MPGESLTLEVRNAQEAIAPASKRAERWLEDKGVPPRAVYLVLLALEELVTNCIKFAYDDAAEHTIIVELSIEPSFNGQVLRMTAIDDGRPFDPLQAPAPDLVSRAEDRQAGGLGLFLLRQMADDIAYERRGGTNRTTLTQRMES
ncbi:MAG: ATP-binding protein [Acidobacteriota bacterium]